MYIQNAISSVASNRSGVDSASPVVAPAPAVDAHASAPLAGSATEAHSKTEQPTPAQLRNAVDKINSSMKEINSNLQFSIDDDTQRVIVKVVESQSGEVIKQFPSEEALSIAKAIDRFQKGLLVKQSA